MESDKKTKKAIKKKAPIPKALRNKVWDNHCGKANMIGKCYCCNKEIDSRVDYDCGHVISEFNGGLTEENNLKLITSKLEIVNNKITGKFKTKNCFGIEKVNRIKEKINLENYDKIVVFGNGKGDYEMLQLRK